jgi:uncharacterized protein (TIGR03089 family)
VTRPADLLARALAENGARPLLTFYDDETGERTELSVATFANWAAKTANLLRDGLDAQPGATLAVRLPVHWQAYVWVQAAWLAGLAVDLRPDAAVDVAVAAHAQTGPVAADEVVSLGLGPMGLPRPGVVPSYAGALDYDREVHTHGDRFVPGPDGEGPALLTDDGPVTAAALVDRAAAAPPLPGGGRLLVTEPVTTVRDVVGGLVVPLVTGVTAVVCRHLDPARLSARIEQESLVAALSNPSGSSSVSIGGLPEFRLP